MLNLIFLNYNTIYFFIFRTMVNINSAVSNTVKKTSATERHDYIGVLNKMRNVLSPFSNMLYNEDYPQYIKYYGEKDDFGLIMMWEDPFVLTNRSIYDWSWRSDRISSAFRFNLYIFFFLMHLSWKDKVMLKEIKKFTLIWSESIMRHINELIRLKFIEIIEVYYWKYTKIILEDALLPINKSRFDEYEITFKCLKIDLKSYEKADEF